MESLLYKEGKDINDIVNSSAFEQVWKIVQAMKDQDERLQHVIEELRISEGKKRFGSIRARSLSEKRRKKLDDIFDLEDSILPKNIDFNKFLDKISVRTLEVVGQNWDEMFGQYVAFKERFGREPNRNKPREKQLCTWCDDQRKSYKNGHLKKYPDRIKKLEDVGFIWDPIADQWDNMYEKYVGFVEENGKPPTQHSRNDNERKLAIWAINQRVRHKKGFMKAFPERIKKLERAGFNWDLIDPNWDDMYKKYINFRKKCGREPSWKTGNEYEKKIANWCTVQMKKYKRDKFARYPDKLKKLEKMGFAWDPFEDQWREMWTKYCEFKKKHNREPKASKGGEERKMCLWCQRQRKNFKEGTLQKEKIKKLEEVSFAWDISFDKRWDELYRSYDEFLKENNREPHKRSKDGGEKRLGIWVSRQKQKAKKGKLSPGRIKKLKEIGFRFKEEI